LPSCLSSHLSEILDDTLFPRHGGQASPRQGDLAPQPGHRRDRA
jgi:hypothetical protein